MTTDTPKNLLTPEFRVSFPFVFRPQKPMNEGGTPKYSVVMLFPKGEKLTALKNAVKELLVEKLGADSQKWPKNLTLPFKDQGDKTMAGYEAGAVSITATSKVRPGLVNSANEDIIDEVEFYSGCYAHATVRPFFYEVKGENGGVMKRGVSFGLQNIQKKRDGEPLSGRMKAQDEFEPVAGAGTSEASVAVGSGGAMDLLN